MEIHEGWLTSCRQIWSPNFNERPVDTDIDLLVIHNISLPPGSYGNRYIDCLFTNTLNPNEHSYFQTIAELKVSAHLLINREGEITQYVAFDKRAWHSGASCHQGRENCNDFSIGIELEGTDTEPYTESQYHSLATVTKLLLTHYPQLNAKRIVGHSDIAPGRKTDPGAAFNWNYFRGLITHPAD